MIIRPLRESKVVKSFDNEGWKISNDANAVNMLIKKQIFVFSLVTARSNKQWWHFYRAPKSLMHVANFWYTQQVNSLWPAFSQDNPWGIITLMSSGNPAHSQHEKEMSHLQVALSDPRKTKHKKSWKVSVDLTENMLWPNIISSSEVLGVETCLFDETVQFVRNHKHCSAASCCCCESGVFHAVDSSYTSSYPQAHTCSLWNTSCDSCASNKKHLGYTFSPLPEQVPLKVDICLPPA